MGHFNGHNPLWGGNTRDAKDKRIEDLVDSHAVCVLNDGSYTYLHPSYRTYSAINLSIVEAELVMDFLWRVWNNLCASDHFPIILNCEGSSPEKRERRWRLRQTDWPTFRTLCHERFTPDTSEIDSFTEMLRWIAEKTVPKISTAPKYLTPP